MENALHHGGAVIIFPEGRVVPPGESVRFKPGAAVLAFRTRTPIIPVRIVGSNELLPLKVPQGGKSFDRSKRVTVYFGKPSTRRTTRRPATCCAICVGASTPSAEGRYTQPSAEHDYTHGLPDSAACRSRCTTGSG